MCLDPLISVCLELQLPPWCVRRMWPTARCAVQHSICIQEMLHVYACHFIEVIMSSCMNQGKSLDARRDVSWRYWLATLGRIRTHDKDKSSCPIPASTHHVEGKINAVVESGDSPLENSIQYVEYFSLCVVCIFCECIVHHLLRQKLSTKLLYSCIRC